MKAVLSFSIIILKCVNNILGLLITSERYRLHVQTEESRNNYAAFLKEEYEFYLDLNEQVKELEAQLENERDI